MPDVRTLPSHTPLAALPAVALDLETTGLDVRRDRIIQIGVVELLGERLIDAAVMDQLIHPDQAIPARSIAIHGIGDDAVRTAPRIEAVLPKLQTILDGKLVVGHNIGFDLAVLRHEAARVGVDWHDPPTLDVAMLAGALQPGLPDLSLETIAREYGVAITRRHRALDDAVVAATVFQYLIARMREIDIRTLGEATAFARRRSDLLVRQAEAGWASRPLETAPGAIESSIRVDSFVYEKRLADLMHSPAATVPAGASLLVAARSMIDRRIGALLVVDADGRPLGILTERDVMRSAATDVALDKATVAEVMSSPVVCMTGDEMLYRALGRMDRLGIRHLCVVDDGGVVTGVVSQRDLLQHRARMAVVLGDSIAQAGEVAALASAFAQVSEVAAGLTEEGLTGGAIARVVSSEIRALSARAAALAEASMGTEGLGTAPAPWCLIVLGSGGRGESLLSADQDNALIHLGNERDLEWFAEFGRRIADLLDQAGLPRCSGGVMASSSEWRGDLECWEARLSQWVARAKSEDLLNVDIFFDLMPAGGEPALARTLRDRALEMATRSPAFLVRLAESVVALASPVGLFGRLRVEDGRVDLKRSGLLQLVSMSRVLALRCGSRARATPERLRDAAVAGRMSEADAERLVATHDHLLTLILRQQLSDRNDGTPLSSRVALKILSRSERRALAAELKAVDEIAGEIRSAMAH